MYMIRAVFLTVAVSRIPVENVGNLRERSVVASGVPHHVAREEANTAAIHPIGHPNRFNCLFLLSVHHQLHHTEADNNVPFNTSSPHSSCSSHERPPRQLICDPTISTRMPGAWTGGWIFAFTVAVTWGLLRKTGAGATSGTDAEGATFFAGAHAAASVMLLATRLLLEVLDSSMRVTGGDSCSQARATLPQWQVWVQT
jgi:hypothetical protein